MKDNAGVQAGNGGRQRMMFERFNGYFRKKLAVVGRFLPFLITLFRPHKGLL